MKLPIYFDYASTTPVDPIVAKKMFKNLTINGNFGNPSSRMHKYGWQAAEAVDIAREKIASLIGANYLEIIFTSGATESNNLALKGAAHANRNKGNHIITSVTEHKTVLDTCKQLEIEGFNITRIVPKKNGIITPKQLNKAIRDNTILVSLMHVNNETGIIQDISEFTDIKNKKNILFHVDATQSIGKLPINISMLPIDLMSFSAHKVYGPKGIGGLYIRGNKNINIEPQMHGGNHEMGIRSGTLPVHQIVGMGEAYNIAERLMKSEIPYIRKLRDMLWNGLQDIEGILINSFLEKTVSNFLNVSFMDLNVESLIMYLKNIAISNGSACNLKSSYVLRAMGIDKKIANNSIRFSLGRFTTIEEIDFAIIYIKKTISKIRKNIINKI